MTMTSEEKIKELENIAETMCGTLCELPSACDYCGLAEGHNDGECDFSILKKRIHEED